MNGAWISGADRRTRVAPPSCGCYQERDARGHAVARNAMGWRLGSHLYIAGTGRAGTSFLVKYLSELGYETTYTRNPDVQLDERANAGLEENPFSLLEPGANPPYVVKSPWLYLVVDELLERGMLNADAVILPMRDLKVAAASRLIVERQSMLGQLALEKCAEPIATWGTTVGGTVQSLEQCTQESVLAVGFYHLVERLVRAGVPIVFLHFPKFVQDGEYLRRQLSTCLDIDPEKAARAFAASASPESVRVSAPTPEDRSIEALRAENAALKRATEDMRQRLQATQSELARTWTLRRLTAAVLRRGLNAVGSREAGPAR